MTRNGLGRESGARALRGRREWAALALCCALLGSIACEKKEPILEQATAEYEAGRYREAVFLIRHHFKKGGEQTAPLLFLAGKAWLKDGSEAEAEDSFDACVKKDPAYGRTIAEFLRSESIAAFAARDTARGRRLMLSALTFQSDLRFGEYDNEAAALFLDRRDFGAAIRYLEAYLQDNPNAPGAAEAMINLASAYEKSGNAASAIETYKQFQERYPKSRLATNALWELENLLMKEAEGCRARGETAQAEEILGNLSRTATSPLVRERANFLLGEMCEERGDAACAASYYRIVIDLGGTGRLVEKAKERIEKMRLPQRRH